MRGRGQPERKIRTNAESGCNELPNFFAIGEEEKQERQPTPADGDVEERGSQQPGLMKRDKDQSRIADGIKAWADVWVKWHWAYPLWGV